MRTYEQIMEAIDKMQVANAVAFAKSEVQREKDNAEQKERWAKMDRKAAKTDKILSNMGLNVGYAAEDYFYSSFVEKKKLGGIKYDSITRNVEAHKGNLQAEYDMILFNGSKVALIEVKHRVHENDVKKYKEVGLVNFRKLFPQYKNHEVYLAIGGISVPHNVEELAYSEGMAVLKVKGEHTQIFDKNMVAF